MSQRVTRRRGIGSCGGDVVTQSCPVCGTIFAVSAFISHKKYCSERCLRKAKAQRKKHRDAYVTSVVDPDRFYEVGHRPTLAQLDDIASFMLKGGTQKPSTFTGVMVNWTAPAGLQWTMADDGRARLEFAAPDIATLIAQGATFVEVPQPKASPIREYSVGERIREIMSGPTAPPKDVVAAHRTLVDEEAAADVEDHRIVEAARRLQEDALRTEQEAIEQLKNL